ncbi:MAG: hypothetical protein ACLFN5_02990 [bacterium]
MERFDFLGRVIRVMVILLGLLWLGCYLFGSSGIDPRSCFVSLARTGARMATRHERIMQQKIAERREEGSLFEIKFGNGAVHVHGAEPYLQLAQEKTEALKSAVKEKFIETREKIEPKIREEISGYIEEHLSSEDDSRRQVKINPKTLIAILTKLHSISPDEETRKLLKDSFEEMKEAGHHEMADKILPHLTSDSPAVDNSD